jgi:phosphoribosylanthranilate isomerase
MTKVKICGITNLDDALLAASLGADALGFNFYEGSPRYIGTKEALAVIDELPDNTMKVGVFVNMEEYKIDGFVDLLGLTAVQLHGDEDAEYVKRLRSETHAEIIKAIRVGDNFSPDMVARYDTDFLLLDTFSAGQYGGTGDSFDWTKAKGITDGKFFLAGGLTPENVSKAVATVRPYGVDVASGVESAPGKKDPKKLEAFIKNAKDT